MTIIWVIILSIIGLNLLAFFLSILCSNSLAKKYISTGKKLNLLKIACNGKLFLAAYLVIGVIFIIVLIQSDTNWFTGSTVGIIVGSGIGLNILATIIWTILTGRKQWYLDSLFKSLENAVKNEGWKKGYLYKNKQQFYNDNTRNHILEGLAQTSEPIDTIKMTK